MPDFQTDDQRGAHEFFQEFMALPTDSRPQAVIKGNAGVGKTWTVGHCIDLYLQEKPNARVVMAAPTNKAVDVLRGKVRTPGVRFCTIDSFLGYRIKRNDDWKVERTKASKSPNKSADEPDLLVVDEGSMVKKDYVEELGWTAKRVLYSMDPAQLQPINEDVCAAASIERAYTMTETVRFAMDSPVNRLAYLFRDRVNDRGFFTLPDIRQAVEGMDNRVTFTNMRKVPEWAMAAVRKGLDCRILAFTNAAVWQHNQTMHNLCFPNDSLFGVGEKALVADTFEMPNEEMLLNGDIVEVVDCQEAEPICGVRCYDVTFKYTSAATVKNADGEWDDTEGLRTVKVALSESEAVQVHKDITNRIYAARDAGDIHTYQTLLEQRRPLNKLAPLRHSYSTTIHKSQGSTYDVGFVDFADVYKARDMRARLFYVGATRTSNWLTFGVQS